MDQTRIAPTEYHSFYEGYVRHADGKELIPLMKSQGEDLIEYWKSIPEAHAGLKYREGSWSIAQLMQHVNDAERIFAYRACAIGRGDKTPLPGFEENDYAEAAIADGLSLSHHIQEFRALRASNVLLFKGFTEEALRQTGTASGRPISVRAIGRILVGHAMHHMNIVKKRYEPLWNQ